MSLKPCLTCQAMISEWARTCPQCGQPRPHATPRQALFGVLVVVLFAAAWFGFIQYKQAEREQEMREFREQHGFPGAVR